MRVMVGEYSRGNADLCMGLGCARWLVSGGLVPDGVRESLVADEIEVRVANGNGGGRLEDWGWLLSGVGEGDELVNVGNVGTGLLNLEMMERGGKVRGF